MTKVYNSNYITVQGWMVNDLQLKGTELMVFAIIYGFSQAEEQHYTGSLQYLADWTGSTKQTVINALKSLLDKGYIGKVENVYNGVKFIEYYSKILNGGSQKILMGGIQKIRPNNIDINNLDNNIGKFHKPTIEDIKAYCIERRNNVDPERFYNYYESNGWKVGKNPMKDYKACIRSWERNTFSTGRKNQSVPDYMTIDYETETEPVSLDETKAMLERMKK